MARNALSFIAAVLVAYTLGSVVATQFVLHEVGALGPVITVPVRLRSTVRDLAGLATSYLPLVALALALALPVAGGLGRFTPRLRLLWFAAAGFAALVVLHLIMNAVLGVTAIAAVRSAPGLYSQGLAGALGGAAFYALGSRRARHA